MLTILPDHFAKCGLIAFQLHITTQNHYTFGAIVNKGKTELRCINKELCLRIQPFAQ